MDVGTLIEMLVKQVIGSCFRFHRDEFECRYRIVFLNRNGIFISVRLMFP
jgi:hypothetical protein